MSAMRCLVLTKSILLQDERAKVVIIAMDSLLPAITEALEKFAKVIQPDTMLKQLVQQNPDLSNLIGKISAFGLTEYQSCILLDSKYLALSFGAKSETFKKRASKKSTTSSDPAPSSKWSASLFTAIRGCKALTALKTSKENEFDTRIMGFKPDSETKQCLIELFNKINVSALAKIFEVSDGGSSKDGEQHPTNESDEQHSASESGEERSKAFEKNLFNKHFEFFNQFPDEISFRLFLFEEVKPWT